MDCNKTTATPSVDGHTGPMKIERIGNAVRHNGNAVAGGGILRLPVWVSEANLLVVCRESVDVEGNGKV